jgi:hypothetical protein
MQRVGFELLIGEVGHDHGGQTHETGSLVLLSVSPTVALLASFHTVCRCIFPAMLDDSEFETQGELTSNRASASRGAIF